MSVFLVLAGQSGRIFAAEPAKGDPGLSAEALTSIEALQQEKATRSPLHRKLDSQLIYALREGRAANGVSAHPHHRSRMRPPENGQVLLDVRAQVTPELLEWLRREGGTVVRAVKELGAVRVRLPLVVVERLAARPEVNRVRPAVEAVTNAGSLESEGGVTHGATSFRNKYRVDGSGVKVGVLSDSVDFLPDVTRSGDLPPVTVLPGQEGLGSGEGTAMLEIVHDIAPGAELYFATAFSGEAGFAQNIRNLYAAGCRIIIDDITYFDESPFQDGIISQAVRDVCAGGALFFSAAGNSGNKADNSAGTWEGDFVDGGVANLGRRGQLHSFGASTFNTVLSGGGFRRLDLFWSDPLGKSTNDYDVYVLDSLGRVVASSTNIQDGNDDPYESISSLNVGDRIVIVKQKGVGRFLHLSTGRARLAVSTGGNVTGHNAATAENAFSVAASWVGANPVLYTPATVSQVEVFSSDGPRRVFYDSAGNPITPGNFSSTGGQVLNKPDITAADGVSTATPDFRPFFGTSAAAPHAGAIAALVWSYNPTLTPGQVRQALLTTALDIETPGVDASSGYGVVMPDAAVATVPQPAPRLALEAVRLHDSNGNGHMDANECGELVFELRNLLASTGATATGIVATLVSLDPEVVFDPAPQTFPNLPPQGRGSNSIPFRISTKSFPSCDRPLHLELRVQADHIAPTVFPFQLETQSPGDSPAVIRSATDVPKPIPDLTETVSVLPVTGLSSPISQVQLELHLLHTYLSDLVVELSGPDGTTVLISANQGGNGSDFGESCAAPTRFSDSATARLGSSSPPYVGTFRAEALLGAFRGKSGSEANGDWRLKIRDVAENDVGVLVCWSIDFRLVKCEEGTGRCLVPPSIVQQPSNLLRVAGQSASFTLQAEGTPPLSYQWYRNGQPIEGAAGSTLTLNSITLADEGQYSATITNPYGMAQTAAASLGLVTVPQITQSPDSVTVPAGDSARFAVGSSGTGPIRFQWFHETDPVPHGTNATLVLASVVPADAGHYRVEVSSPYGMILSDPAVLVVVSPPMISLMPADLVVTNGDPAMFRVQATGSQPLSFLWFKNGSELIPDAQQAELALPATTLADSGFYSVVVSNQAGVVNSRQARLDVFQAVQFLISPTNQVLPLHGTAELVSLASGVPPPVYQWYRSTADSFEPVVGATNATLRLAALSFSDSLRYRVIASNLLSMRTSEVAQIQVLDLPLITTQPHSEKVAAGSPAKFEVQVTGAGPFTYQWFFNTSTPLAGATQPQLLLPDVQLAQVGVYHVAISNLVGGVVSQPASLEVGAPVSIVSQPTGVEVALDDSATFHVGVTGDLPVTYQWLFNQTNLIAQGTNDTLELVSLGFDQTGDYQVVVANFAGSTTSQVARLEVLQPAFVVADPLSVSVNLGGVLELAAAADGAQPLIYRWFFNDDQLIPEATGPTLRLEGIRANQGGSYFLEVSNRVGTARSAPAFVQVILPARSEGIDGETTVALGGRLELHARVGGTAPFSFEWLRGDTLIPGQSSGILLVQDLQFSDAGSYRFRVSNAAGSALSDPVVVSVLEAPIISVPPQPQLLAVGQDLSLTPVVVGSEPLTYWWIYNTNQVLAGENGPSLHVGAIQPSQAGTYQLLVSNAVGRASSPHVHVRVEDPPQLLSEPEDVSFARGAAARLTALASGSPVLRFQWFREGMNPVPDATNLALLIPNVSSNEAGGYQLVVANDVGSVTSRVATLHVKEVPWLLSQPVDQTVVEGGQAEFSISALSAGALRYQWIFNGLFSLPDQTNANLILTNVTSTMEGDYSVEVSNDEGTVVSSRAKLRVIVAPSVATQPADQIVALGSIASFAVEVAGSLPISFQWFMSDATPLVDATNALVHLGPVAFSDAGGVYVIAANSAGSVTSRVASLTVLEPPSIISPPQPLIVVQGASAHFQVEARGHAPLFYQWFGPDGQAISGAEASVLDIAAVRAIDAGPFSVQVSNQVGVVRSVEALLTVIRPPAVVLENTNLLAAIGGQVTLVAVGSGSEPLHYQWLHDVTNVLAQATNATLVLSQLDATNSGIYQVEVSNAAGVVTSEEAHLAVVPAPHILSEPQPMRVPQGSVAAFQVTATGYEPLSYQWMGPDSQPIPGAVGRVLELPNVQPAQEGLYSVWVSNAVGVATSQLASLGVVVPPEIAVQPADRTIAIGATVSFHVEATGTAPLSFQWFYQGSQVLLQATNDTLVLENASAGLSGAYSVEVSNLAGTVRSVAAQLRVLAPPQLIEAPHEVIAIQGTTAIFQVNASGDEPLSYQWFGPSGSPIEGQVSPTLSLNSVQPSQEGSYSVRVSNEVGEVTSPGALLRVIVAPSILVSPADHLAARGGSASLTVSASGTDPLVYTWFFQLTNVLAGATNATLVLDGLQIEQSGPYLVMVSNAAGVAVSSAAELRVVEPPSIVRQPDSLRVLVGHPARFEVVAAGEPPLTYQWIGPDLSLVPGGTGPVLDLNAVSASDAGAYRVEVRNAVGLKVSDAVMLDVVSPPVIKDQPQDLLAARGAVAELRVAALGSEPLRYQWLLFATNVVADATNAWLRWESVDSTNAGVYSVVVSNDFGTVTSAEVTVEVLARPSIVSVSPDVSVVLGHSATLQVEVSGDEPLSFQWYRNGNDPIPGAVARKLELPAVRVADEGNYTVRVTNPVGSVESDPVALRVLVPPFVLIAPRPAVVPIGAKAEFQITAGGTEPIFYQWMRNGTEALEGETNRILTFSAATFAHSGHYSVVLSNLGGVLASEAAELRVLEPPVVRHSPASATVATGSEVRLTVDAGGSPTLTFQWYSDGGVPILGASTPVLVLPAAQPSDSGRYFVEVGNEVGVVNSLAATVLVLDPPSLLSEPEDRTVASGTTVELKAEIAGSQDLDLRWYFFETNQIPQATTNPLVLPSVSLGDSGIYTLTVTNAVGGVVSRRIALTVLDAPKIVAVPRSLTVLLGEDAAFEVEALGSSLRYQWFKDGSIPIPGGTSRRLVLPKVDLGSVASYSVAVSNAVGISSSTAASLRVLVPAQILSFAYDGSLVAVSFFSHKNLRYTLENNDQLGDLGWRVSSGSLRRKGTDGVITLYDVPGDALIRFYRILVE